MLMPKRTKYRRPHRVSYEGKAKGVNQIDNGEYALVALEGAWITNRQIEAARIAMTRHMKRVGKVWINIFPHLAKTKKPLLINSLRWVSVQARFHTKKPFAERLKCGPILRSNIFLIQIRCHSYRVEYNDAFSGAPPPVLRG